MAQPIQAITIQTQPPAPITTQQNWSAWQQYFNPQVALQSVKDYIEAKPSSRTERHTMKAYMSSLCNYCTFLDADITHHGAEDYTWNFTHMTMPTLQNTQAYIAHLSQLGLASSTIQRYMASIRHFIKALEYQMPVPQSGNDFMFIMQAQNQFKVARDIKNPAPDKTTSRPAMETTGYRLELQELDLLFSSFRPGLYKHDITTLMGKRDLALIYLGMVSGLRASELARLTLANITQQDEDNYAVTVRGKRNKYDPVGIDAESYNLIINYITAWNQSLPEDDPRQITDSTPLFQTMGSHGTIPPLKSAKPNSEIHSRTITRLVARRVAIAIPKYKDISFSAHNMRRTCAYIMRELNYEWDEIRDKLRHYSIATTEKYVGRKLDLSKSNWTQKRKFNIPSDPTNKLPI